MSDYNGKRIMKNTAILYLRMAVLLILSLYTSRIVYNALGEANYGLYNLVGGIVVFFSFLNNGLGTATKRYLTAEVGKNSDSENHIFNICFQAHLLIALFVFIGAEIIGPFAIEHWLNIPKASLYGAKWVYQVSIIITILGIISSPYGTIIAAYERFGVVAIMSIIDVVVKLLIVYLLQMLQGEKLVIYSNLLLGSCVIANVVTYLYCRLNFHTCRLRIVKDWTSLRKIFNFMGWSILGQIAVVGTNQGVSVLINMFYSVLVNAAMGISNTITSIVSKFVSNFQSAFNPQIIKLYNTGDEATLTRLVVRASKISSYLIIIFLIPICIEIKTLLNLWLGDYPEYSPEFTILTLFAILIEALSAPLWMVVYSQSNIKKYQIYISSVYSMNFFLGWVALYLGFMPYVVITVRIGVFIILMFIRLWFVHIFVESFSIKLWLREVLLKSIIILLTSFLIVGIISKFLMINGFFHLVIVSLISVTITCSLILFGGFDKYERSSLVSIIKKKLLKR